MEQCNSRAGPVDYHAVIIAECARVRLRGRGTHPSATYPRVPARRSEIKSTALNAADSGRGGVSACRSEIKVREGVCLGSPGHLPSSPLPSSPPLHPEPAAKSERKKKERARACLWRHEARLPTPPRSSKPCRISGSRCHEGSPLPRRRFWSSWRPTGCYQ
jgi:hypothetical protein